jgi:hypothetical protein
MNIKGIITGILLLFVVGSVAYMGLKEIGSSESRTDVVELEIATPEAEQISVQSETATPDAKQVNVQAEIITEPGSESAEISRSVIAYYFHGDKRCQTCIKLESYAKEALEANFADEFKAGQLEWEIVNIDEEANEHFVEDYELVTKAVVLVSMADGKQVNWQNLEQIWNLVSDKAAYLEYVTRHTEEFLKTEL